jgi:acid stress chaperone HdeA
MIFAVTTPAVAAESIKKPVTQWTCADFLAIDEAFQPKVVYAATAYSKARKPEGVIDIDGTETVTPVIISNCKKDAAIPVCSGAKSCLG